MERWLRWYRDRGIEAIGAAFLLLRRRADDGPPRLQALEAVTAPTPRAGTHVERILAGTDLAGARDDGLLATRLRVARGVRVEDGRIRALPTVGVEAAVPAELAGFVHALDGARALRDTLPASRRAEAVALARRLLELGFLEPAS